MTSFADWAADLFVETSTPKEQKPCSSGGVTWMNATSSGRIPSVKSWGTSERRIGVKSARPSLTAGAHALADEERVDPDVAREARVGVGRLPERQDVA